MAVTAAGRRITGRGLVNSGGFDFRSLGAAPVLPRSLAFGAVSDLTRILHGIEISERFGDQPIRADPPLLESTDPDAMTGSGWSAVRAFERPLVDYLFLFLHQVVHVNLEVGKSGHESLCGFGNCVSPHRRGAAIDGQ